MPWWRLSDAGVALGQVPAVLWAGLQSLDELTQAGVCAEKEEQIDEDLGPWESTGGVITQEQVCPPRAMPCLLTPAAASP
jgi:hypothetical protein